MKIPQSIFDDMNPLSSNIFEWGNENELKLKKSRKFG